MKIFFFFCKINIECTYETVFIITNRLKVNKNFIKNVHTPNIIKYPCPTKLREINLKDFSFIR